MKPHKSTSHYLTTGEPNKVVALSKAEHRKVQAAVERRGLTFARIPTGLTRAEREERSRQRQIFYAQQRATTLGNPGGQP